MSKCHVGDNWTNTLEDLCPKRQFLTFTFSQICNTTFPSLILSCWLLLTLRKQKFPSPHLHTCSHLMPCCYCGKACPVLGKGSSLPLLPLAYLEFLQSPFLSSPLLSVFPSMFTILLFAVLTTIFLHDSLFHLWF